MALNVKLPEIILRAEVGVLDQDVLSQIGILV
jgi:hypothetical protein